jgi:hypothetical protein
MRRDAGHPTEIRRRGHRPGKLPPGPDQGDPAGGPGERCGSRPRSDQRRSTACEGRRVQQDEERCSAARIVRQNAPEYSLASLPPRAARASGSRAPADVVTIRPVAASGDKPLSR